MQADECKAQGMITVLLKCPETQKECKDNTKAKHNIIPNFLCSISSRKLQLLFWTARLHTPTYLQDCTSFVTQLGNLYNESEMKNKVLPLYVKFPCHKVAHGRSLSLLFQKSHLRLLRGRYWLSSLSFQSNSSNCLVLIPHRQWGTTCSVLVTATAKNNMQNLIQVNV